MILIKSAEVYAPEYLGIKDVLISGDKIIDIKNRIDACYDFIKIIDGKNKKLIPGLIDRHVHITGGGGEGGLTTKVPEIKVTHLIESGVTTVVGLLGTDGTTRRVEDLVAKAKAINEIGLTSYALTGSYEYPSVTLSGQVKKDMVFISEIIGAKIAVSDHRSSHMTENELLRLASDVYVGGKLSGKQGILTIHMGDGKNGLKPITNAVNNSDLPITVFHPTHCNRNEMLIDQSVEFLKSGGWVDLTTGISTDNSPSILIKKLLKDNIDTKRVTVSSDGNGSYSNYDDEGRLLAIGASDVKSTFNELQEMISLGIPFESALTYFTLNVSQSLGLNDKGTIEIGKDADLLLLDDMMLKTVISRGKIMMEDNKIQVKIPFE